MGAKRGHIVWFTGLSGAGKSTLCCALQVELELRGHRSKVLDGDEIRCGLCADLGFTQADRTENIRRVAHVAEILASTGLFVLVAVICPFQSLRDMIRVISPDMIEVFVDAPLVTCEQRDTKGLYRRARLGELLNFTGIDSPFDIPIAPDFICQTGQETVAESLDKLMHFLEKSRLIEVSVQFPQP